MTWPLGHSGPQCRIDQRLVVGHLCQRGCQRRYYIIDGGGSVSLTAPLTPSLSGDDDDNKVVGGWVTTISAAPTTTLPPVCRLIYALSKPSQSQNHRVTRSYN
jgi:hypothetical protein